MKLAAATIALALLGVLGFVVAGNTEEPQNCPVTLTFGDRTYIAHETELEVTSHDMLGSAREERCGSLGDEIAMSRVAGVSPKIALVTPVMANVLYLAEGVSVDSLPDRVAHVVVE